MTYLELDPYNVSYFKIVCVTNYHTLSIDSYFSKLTHKIALISCYFIFHFVLFLYR